MNKKSSAILVFILFSIEENQPVRSLANIVNLRKNNSKRVYQLVKDVTTVKRESDYCPISFREMPHRRATDTEPMDRLLL